VAAVHEEVARLPEALRVPFVLCCLEGRTVTEAAGHLGWKVTTLSARLGRAKDILLARLQTRGLTAGAVAALAVAAEGVPAGAAQAAVALAKGSGTVGDQVRFLTHGVIGMSAHRVKLMAAGVLVATGLGVGGGAGWLGTADAQGPPGPLPARTTEEKVRQLEAQLDRAKRELEDERAADLRRAADEVGRAATARWEYAFVRVHDLDADGFGRLLSEREAAGWDYTGQATLKAGAVWVFRRPAGGTPAGRYGPPAPAASQPGANSARPKGGYSPFDAAGPRPEGNRTAPGGLPAGPAKP
jgi:hypothetical protein